MKEFDFPYNLPIWRDKFQLDSLTFFILIFLICPVALAVLPPKYYEEAFQSSAIKAIAVVKKVDILDENNRSTFKKVLFKLEKAFPGKKIIKKPPVLDTWMLEESLTNWSKRNDGS